MYPHQYALLNYPCLLEIFAFYLFHIRIGGLLILSVVVYVSYKIFLGLLGPILESEARIIMISSSA